MKIIKIEYCDECPHHAKLINGCHWCRKECGKEFRLFPDEDDHIEIPENCKLEDLESEVEDVIQTRACRDDKNG